MNQKDPAAGKVAREILSWAKLRVTRIWWGEGATIGAFVPIFVHKSRDYQLFALSTNGTVEIYFYWYQYKPPFEAEEERIKILDRFNQLEGVSFSNEVLKKRPSIRLSLLSKPETLHRFLSIFDWMLEEIKKA